MRKLTALLLTLFAFSASAQTYNINYSSGTMSIIGLQTASSNNFSYIEYYPTQVKFVGFGTSDIYINTADVDSVNGVAIGQPITATELIAYLDSIVALPTTYTASDTLDFPEVQPQESGDLTFTLTGAEVGDVVILGVPNDAVEINTCYTAWVSGTNTITVRFNNYSLLASNPIEGIFKVTILK